MRKGVGNFTTNYKTIILKKKEQALPRRLALAFEDVTLMAPVNFQQVSTQFLLLLNRGGEGIPLKILVLGNGNS
jgi:hypothetical protein